MDWNQIFARIVEPFGRLADPAERIFVPYLVTSLFLALAVYGVRYQRQYGIRGLARYVFPVKKLLHPSSRLDGKLLLTNMAWKAIAVTPFGLTAFGISIEVVTLLEKFAGVPQEPNFPVWFVGAVYTIALAIVWDGSRYLLHRFAHSVPFLWEFHKVHHSAQVLTPLTLYRVHPVESLLFALRGTLATGLVTGVFFYFFRGQAVQWTVLGVNVLGFVFNLFGANLRHSHVWLSFGPLEKFLLSPAQHQIHHSANPEDFNKNFGTWLSIWDRIGNSWKPSGKTSPASFGLDAAETNHAPDSLLGALLGPVLPRRSNSEPPTSAV